MPTQIEQIEYYQNNGVLLEVDDTRVLSFSALDDTPLTGTLAFEDADPPTSPTVNPEWDLPESATVNGQPATLVENAVLRVGAGINLVDGLGLNVGGLVGVALATLGVDLSLDLALSDPVGVGVMSINGVEYLRFYDLATGEDTDPAELLNGLVGDLTDQINDIIADIASNPLLNAIEATLTALTANTAALVNLIEQNLITDYQVTAAADGMDVTCFTADTLILTRKGPVRAVEIAKGDEVLTLDNGYQPVRWAGRSRLSTARLIGEPRLRPIRFAAGSLGPDVPQRDMMVSPQHRCLLRNRVARNMVGVPEVLVPAKHLTGLPGVEVVDDLRPVTYVHLLLDRHEVVHSDGALTETLYLGPMARDSFDDAARAELEALFPEMFAGATPVTPAPARPFLNGKQTRKLVERALRNRRALVEEGARTVTDPAMA